MAPQETAGLHEGERPDTGDDTRECIDGPGALKRQQGTVFHVVERDFVGQEFAQMPDVIPFHSPVDDNIDAHRRLRDHQVIKNAARIVQEQGIAHLSLAQAFDVCGNQGFQRFFRAVTGQHQLPHVRHIEQARAFARPQMFGHDAFILDWHRIARKRNHPRTQCAVPVSERQFEDFGFVVTHHRLRSKRSQHNHATA